MTPMPRPSRTLLTVLVVAGVLPVCGCGDPDTIRVLDEPKPQHPAPQTVPPAQQQFRTLAAMFPRDSGGNWWFFKFSGPADVVARHEADFRKLIESVRVSADEDEPVAWVAPAGWTQIPGSGSMRYATLRGGDPGKPVEVSITTFGGTVLQNVNRWRAELGLDPVSPSALNTATQTRTVNGRLAILMDSAGPNNPSDKPRPMAMPGHP